MRCHFTYENEDIFSSTRAQSNDASIHPSMHPSTYVSPFCVCVCVCLLWSYIFNFLFLFFSTLYYLYTLPRRIYHYSCNSLIDIKDILTNYVRTIRKRRRFRIICQLTPQNRNTNVNKTLHN